MRKILIIEDNELNLKLMKETLDEKQYAQYVRLMALTLNNKGINIEK